MLRFFLVKGEVVHALFPPAPLRKITLLWRTIEIESKRG
jgi:hypothetical protein